MPPTPTYVGRDTLLNFSLVFCCGQAFCFEATPALAGCDSQSFLTGAGQFLRDWTVRRSGEVKGRQAWTGIENLTHIYGV